MSDVLTAPQSTPEQRITQAYRASCDNFRPCADIMRHLGARWDYTGQQLGQVVHHIDNMATPPSSREAMIATRDRILSDALTFFTEWQACPVADGAALLYRQQLPPQPEPPTASEIFNGTLMGMQRRGIAFETEGSSLVVTPASILSEADKAFVRHNKKQILSMVREKADAWLV